MNSAPGRRGRRRAARALGAGLVAALLASCGLVDGDPSSSSTPTDPNAYRMEPTCAPPPREFPVSAEIVNRVVSGTSTLPAWEAGDIGASARLSDGRLVWVFGDTVRGDDYIPKIVANSMLLSSGLCLSQVMTRFDRPVIPDVSEKVVHWPMSVARLDPAKIKDPAVPPGTSDILVVFTGRIERGTQNALDFRYLGFSATIFTVKRGEAPQRMITLEITPDRTNQDQIHWGAAAMVDQGWYYVYGSRLPKGSFGRELYVGRAPVARPAVRSGWQFWDGTRWQSDLEKARPVLPASEGVSQTLSVSRTHGQYVVVSKKDGDLGDFVYTWSSRSPTGPWRGRQGVKAPYGVNQDELQYAPLGHPEIPLESGKLLVSISRNTTDLRKLLREPEQVGRPVFTEVEIPPL